VNCNEVLDQLADYLDEDARAELCHAIEEHLAQCADCQIEVDTLKKTIVLYQSDRATAVPLNVSARLRAVMMNAYEERTD
jgi:predicted anti-sigma-YlaC factor YlaD